MIGDQVVIRCLEAMKVVITARTTSFLQLEKTTMHEAAAAIATIATGLTESNQPSIEIGAKLNQAVLNFVQECLHVASSSALLILAESPSDQNQVRTELLSVLSRLASTNRSWRSVTTIPQFPITSVGRTAVCLFVCLFNFDILILQ